jgi:Domain of unknown function (DUF4338)
MERELIVRRRRIGPEEVEQIRQLIAEEGCRGRSHISNRLCEIWDWRQANGRHRQIACRDLLRQLQSKGLIELPPVLKAARRIGYVNQVSNLEGSDRVPLQADLRSVRDEIRVELAQEVEKTRRFNRLIGGGHYLGYQQPTGAQLKYLAWRNDAPVACVSFGPAAFKVAPRDQFIGWTPERRQQRLDWLVNNDRFLILPWVQVRGLASLVLSQCLRRLRTDWQAVYHHDLALAESFIQQDRFTGRCYAAANWRCVGPTRGRGRNDRWFEAALPVKTVWLYPLRTDFREVLCAPA